MASYKNYAENLIGNWEKDIYEPQKDVTKAIYQTNWDALTNNYNDVKDKLARNFNLARNEYANALDDVQNASFNRMRNANIDLANRGLSGSGMLNLVTQGDTQIKGQTVDKALADLLSTNNASLEGLREGVIGLGEKQSKLASDLAGDIGRLTDADAANNQQYGGLLAGIAEGAAQRAASRAGSGRSKKAKQAQKEADEIGRRIRISDVLTSTDLTDQEKGNYLVTYLDVPPQTAIDAISAYNNNNLLQTNRGKINKLQSSMVSNNGYTPAALVGINNLINLNKAKNVSKLQNEIKDLTYTDLAKLLYGDK